MRYSTHPSFAVGAALSVLAAWIFGACAAGELENPERFEKGAADCDIEQIFSQCGGSICHEGSDPPGGVDLLSAGVADRVYDAPASYKNVRDSSACPTEPELLVDPSDVEGSLLLTKLLGTHRCGDPMPPGLAMPQADVDCVRQWAQELINQRNQTGPAGMGGAE